MSVRRAFPPIELLVAIAIVAILFPVFDRAEGAAKRSVCAGDLKQVGLSLAMYAADADDTFPNRRFYPLRRSPRTKRLPPELLALHHPAPREERRDPRLPLQPVPGSERLRSYIRRLLRRKLRHGDNPGIPPTRRGLGCSATSPGVEGAEVARPSESVEVEVEVDKIPYVSPMVHRNDLSNA